MIKIGVLTTTRAEYGLMRQLLFKLNKDPDFELKLLVSGTHLSHNYGYTIDEIKADNLPIASTFDILFEKNGVINPSLTMAKTIEVFTEYFSNNKLDLLFVDGDRYETLAVCIAAVNNNIPIAHCGGGATTEGSNDEIWRHAITKMSYLHFVTCDLYKKRIICMGEDPSRVFVSGSPGIDNIRVMELGTKSQLEKRINKHLDKPYALVTFHPVIMEDSSFEQQISEILNVCSKIDDMMFIFTMANADQGGSLINEKLLEFCKKHSNSVCVSSLGAFYYLTAMKYCEFVMGNSSSGLIEAPSLKIPTVNIGDRQKGRLKAKSIIDCKTISSDIYRAILIARSTEFKCLCKNAINPYGDGFASDVIISKIKDVFGKGLFSLKKNFYDYKE